MQVCDQDPVLNPRASAVKENMFALGDCTQTPLNEEKSLISLKFLAQYVAKNITAIATGQKPSFYLPFDMPFWRLISVGPKYGLLCINGMVKDGEEAIKAKRESLELEH